MVIEERAKRQWLITLLLVAMVGAGTAREAFGRDVSSLVAGVDYVPGEVLVRIAREEPSPP